MLYVFALIGETKYIISEDENYYETYNISIIDHAWNS